jgi:tRNA(fMet)-specific endonuclease VapC
VIWLLDSNILIYALNGVDPVRQRPNQAEVRGDRVITSVIVRAELDYGAESSARPEQNIRRLRERLIRFEVLPVTNAVADRYGALRARLRAAGKPKSDFDPLIAATALEAGATLVTNDRALLDGSIPGLTVENWV